MKHPSLIDTATTTGESLYPTAMILHRLGLIPWMEKGTFEPTRTELRYTSSIGNADLERQVREVGFKKLLSLGEGYSGLTPYLRGKGIAAFGLDLWYGQDLSQMEGAIGGGHMLEYVRNHKQWLIPGSVTDMKAQVADASFDVAVSHFVLYYLKAEAQIQAVEEILRVLKPGGYAILVNPPDYIDPIVEYAKKNRLDFLYQRAHSVFRGTLHLSSMDEDTYLTHQLTDLHPPPEILSFNKDIDRIIIRKR